MKNVRLLLLTFLFIGSFSAFAQWSAPVQITKGASSDIHSAFVNSEFARGTWDLGETDEWLAFARLENGHSNICLLSTQLDGIQWGDSVYYVTNDSAMNDFPSMAREFVGDSSEKMMLVWQRNAVHSDIYYDYNNGARWLYSSALTHDSVSDNSPCVAPRDSGFDLTWERAGQIVFSEFRDSVWSPFEQVTHTLMPVNFLPQVVCINNTPVVVWEQVKEPDTTRAIMYSVRGASGWTAPDTLAWQGDNRNPSFCKNGLYLSVITWESKRDSDWEIFGTDAEIVGDSLIHHDPGNITNNPSVDDHQFSGNMTPLVITSSTRSRSQYFYISAATWHIVSPGGDAIAVAINGEDHPQYFTPAGGSANRNPTISFGVISRNFYEGDDAYHFWSVWENNSTGTWKLYGSKMDYVLGVNDAPSIERSFILRQNYPNPFNPATQISYTLSKASNVTLTIYDILGQRVVTLVNEKNEPGEHSVNWNAQDIPSGVYFYRIVAGNFVQTKKMVLMK